MCAFIICNLGLLKKHYRALCHSLPEDVTKTRAKLLQYSRVLPSSAIEKIAPAANSETVNQKIVNFLIISCKDDSEIIHFCDLFEKLVENPFFIHNVEMLRNGIVIFIVILYVKHKNLGCTKVQGQEEQMTESFDTYH